VDIQRQLDLFLLGLRGTLNGRYLVCDLRSAGLSVRPLLGNVHMLVDLLASLRVRQHSCLLPSFASIGRLYAFSAILRFHSICIVIR